jgi:hypothetical protein
LKTEKRIELSQHESWWVQTIIGYLCIYPTFPYRIKRKVFSGDLPFLSDPTTGHSVKADDHIHSRRIRALLLIIASQVNFLSTSNALCIVQRATAY